MATVLFTVAAIARIPFWEVLKSGWPFTLVLALVTLLVTYVPWISLGKLNDPVVRSDPNAGYQLDTWLARRGLRLVLTIVTRHVTMKP